VDATESIQFTGGMTANARIADHVDRPSSVPIRGCRRLRLACVETEAGLPIHLPLGKIPLDKRARRAS
jgi:hypothetical protein